MPKKELYGARRMSQENGSEVTTRIVINDGSKESMILLTGLKNIFQKQLPKMPKDYIARLIYDRYSCRLKSPCAVLTLCVRKESCQHGPRTKITTPKSHWWHLL